jgi:methionyl aminopeptidase
MMITVKSGREIELMRQAGKIAAGARSVGRQAVRSGLTTKEIDRAVHEFIVRSGAVPSCLGYEKFPAATCISVNEEVIHGIPGKRIVKNGDIVSIDLCAAWKGYIGDCAGTYACGKVSPQAQKLIETARKAFFEGLKYARAGNRILDISGAVQDCVESNGFSVVRAFVGHGIGQEMHEAPEVPNYRPDRESGGRSNPRLVKGMTICIEPMICAGDYEVRILRDGWTVVTEDRSLAAHYENTILITDGEPEILTIADDI